MSLIYIKNTIENHIATTRTPMTIQEAYNSVLSNIQDYVSKLERQVASLPEGSKKEQAQKVLEQSIVE